MGQPVVHFEIGCEDRTRASHFYAQMFGWDTTDTGLATMIDTGSKDGIQGHLTVLGHDPLHYVLVYIQVEDLSSSLDRLSALGGAVVVPPVQLPDGRRFAWIRDPEGNTIGIITPPPTN